MTTLRMLTAAEAERISWDAVVIGAGPAGAVVARELARRECHTLLVDKEHFPRSKVCGGCVGAFGREMLAELGALPEIPQVPYSELWLRGYGCEARLTLPRGVVLDRRDLDWHLVRSAQAAGVSFIPGVRARLGGCRAHGRDVDLSDRGGRDWRVESRLVVAADGLGSSSLAGVASSAAVDGRRTRIGASLQLAEEWAPGPAGPIHMFVGRGGYVGAVRLPSGQWHLAAALDSPAAGGRGAVDAWVRKLLKSNGIGDLPGGTSSQWQCTPSLRRPARCLSDQRLFVVGDAAGYIEPFTGEGITWAILGALTLAPIAAAACRDWSFQYIREWQTAYRQAIGRRQRWCRCLAAALGHPWMAGMLLRGIRCAPSLGAEVARRLHHSSTYHPPTRNGRRRTENSGIVQ